MEKKQSRKKSAEVCLFYFKQTLSTFIHCLAWCAVSEMIPKDPCVLVIISSFNPLHFSVDWILTHF